MSDLAVEVGKLAGAFLRAPCLGEFSPFGGEFGKPPAIGEQLCHEGAETFDLVGGADGAALRAENVGGAHGWDAEHRQAGGHGFEQHQPLGFGDGGEGKQVGSRIAARQLFLPVEVAEEEDILGDAKAGGGFFVSR